MNITLMMVVSVDGKITRGDDPDVTKWTSKEDRKLFLDAKGSHPVIIMGSRTYSLNRTRIRLSDRVLRIVLTRNPQGFLSDAVPGQLEFTDDPPPKLVARLTSKGFERALLLGGAIVNASFFRHNLIDSLSLTVEPILFGKGKNILSPVPIDVQLTLVGVRKLNSAGTLHLTYAVRKNV